MNVQQLKEQLNKALIEYAIISGIVSELRIQLIIREWTRKVNGK